MGEEAGTGSCPECGTGRAPGQLLCRGCFVPYAMSAAAHAARVPSPSRDATVVSQHPATRRDVPVPALRLRFPGGEIVPVEPGVRIRLGRDPRQCPDVTFLAAHGNLSRVHATVAVDPDGSAWITDEGSTNGTFAYGYRLAPKTRAALRPGDVIRLAADVTVRVLT